MKNLFAASLLLLSTVAFAGDAAKLTHLGFSSDGKSYAFMESGVQDGSGFAYANIRFLNTALNSYSSPSVSVLQVEEDTISTVRDIEDSAIKKAKESLAKLQIDTSLKGDVVISRKITDLAARKLTDATFSLYPMIRGLTSPQYKLKLTVTPAKAADGACMDLETKKMKLVLVGEKGSSVLQEDKSLPASRRCATNYEIEDVVVMQPDQMSTASAKIVVLLRVYSLGFEGDDVRYMAVSGSLE